MIVSPSANTLIYKGMLTSRSSSELRSPTWRTRGLNVRAGARPQQRFSTNTFLTLALAHPYRMIAHNGEINTLRGNINWMQRARRSAASERFGPDLPKRAADRAPKAARDSATFDNVLELLMMAGRSLPHGVMMMIPEACAGPRRPVRRTSRASTTYHSCLMEPWDGPAAVAFTDGTVIGATLDRNGLRPGRWRRDQGRLRHARRPRPAC